MTIIGTVRRVRAEYPVPAGAETAAVYGKS